MHGSTPDCELRGAYLHAAHPSHRHSLDDSRAGHNLHMQLLHKGDIECRHDDQG